MKVIAAVLVVGALLLVAGPVKRAYDSAHIGAPALIYHCPAGTFVKRWWVPASSGGWRWWSTSRSTSGRACRRPSA